MLGEERWLSYSCCDVCYPYRQYRSPNENTGLLHPGMDDVPAAGTLREVFRPRIRVVADEDVVCVNRIATPRAPSEGGVVSLHGVSKGNECV